MTEENKKVEETKEAPSDAKDEKSPASTKATAPVKSPKKPEKQATVNVKLVRSIDRDTGLFVDIDSPGDFYLVALEGLEPGTRTTAIVPSEHGKPFDWKPLLKKHLPSYDEMIQEACDHMVKNGMVELSDLNNNALRSKVFREMLNYSLPKNPEE